MNELLPSVDLQTLIEIGDELGWFHIGEERLEAFREVEEWNLSNDYKSASPREVIGRLQHFRNGVHPGKAIRENFKFDEQSNKTSLWLAFMSLAGVLVYAQEDELLKMTLPVHPVIRKMLDGEGDMPRGVHAALFMGAAMVVLPGEEAEA